MTKENKDNYISSMEEYFQLEVKEPQHVDSLFVFLKRYMDDIVLRQERRILLPFEGIVDKFVCSVRTHTHISDEEIKNIGTLARRLVELGLLCERRKIVINKWSPLGSLFFMGLLLSFHQKYYLRTFHEFYTVITRLYNRFCVSRDSVRNHLDLFDFYLPDFSNKQRATELIQEVINLIQDENTLSITARKRIIAHLNDALNELKNPKPNWASFFGKIKEVVIVMGAVGSIVGGQCALIDAKNKLEEAIQVINETSINTYYINLSNNQLTSSSQNISLLPEGLNSVNDKEQHDRNMKQN